MITQPAPSDFTTQIDNPFLTLRPGTTFVYRKADEGEEIRLTITDQTRIVDGVTTLVARDIEYVNGVVVEDTLDYFAQDSAGNVWYFGEDTTAFDPIEGTADTSGSWIAGENGAKAGIVMLADPLPGTRYMQEDAPGEAEDYAVVLDQDSAAFVPYGDFPEDVLRTRDVNPLDPSEERKFYAEGVGTLLTTDEDGEREALVRIIVKGGAGSDMLEGYGGGDLMLGKRGRDDLRGAEGGDTLKGGTGADTLRGGEGFDILNGGGGDDLLRGGGDGDVFAFRHLGNGRAETDIIADYRATQFDVLDIAGGAGSVIDQTRFDGGWALTLAGDGDVIRLLGVVDSDNDGQITDHLIFA